MDRTCTVTDGDICKTYRGFNKDFRGEIQHVALYTVDGELQIVALEDTKDADDTEEINLFIASLISYILSQPGKKEFLGVYTRISAEHAQTLNEDELS